MFSGQVWNATRARRAGLVNDVIDETEFEATAQALIQAIGANSLDAIRALKKGLSAVESADPAALAASERQFEALFAQPDFIEGRNAFLQKRTAKFPSHIDSADTSSSE